MKIVREITSCSYICGADMHFQNLHSANREDFQLYVCDTRLHVKRYIALAVWRVGFPT